MAAVGGVTFDAVLETRHINGEEEVLLAWMPTWMKTSGVTGLANAHWKCTRPAHYMQGVAQQGGAGASGSGSGSRPPQTARKTARGPESNMDDAPPAKRGPGRPRKWPKTSAPKPTAPKPPPELITPELLHAKRGPGRPPKWLTEARRAAEKRKAKAEAKPKPKPKMASLAALAATHTAEVFAKRGPGRPPKWLAEARRAAEAAQVLAGLA